MSASVLAAAPPRKCRPSRRNRLWRKGIRCRALGATEATAIEQTAIREVKEETGLDVEVTALVGIYTNPNHIAAFTDGEVRQQFSLCFTTELRGGELAIDHESTDIAWTAHPDIGQLDMHPSMRLRITHYLEQRTASLPRIARPRPAHAPADVPSRKARTRRISQEDIATLTKLIRFALLQVFTRDLVES